MKRWLNFICIGLMNIPFFTFVINEIYASTNNTPAFLYPVASCKTKPILYVMYQKSPNHIELWLWNYITKQATLVLQPRFQPVGIAVLPDESGFSFIDNGLIYVKFFHKRSPKLLEPDMPIYAINSVSWIDNQHCYISAKMHNHYGIFQLDLEGRVNIIAKNVLCDYQYPQKIGDDFFYIERQGTIHQQYRIMHTQYSNNSCDKENQLILDFEERPIAFLHMVSQSEGFFIEHPSEIKKDCRMIRCMYHHIKKDGSDWHDTILFIFDIPTSFLFFDSTMRLCESILPLLPRHDETDIYYTSATQNECLNIFRYNVASHVSVQKTHQTDIHYFAPCKKGQIFFGGAYAENSRFFVCDGSDCIMLPSI